MPFGLCRCCCCSCCCWRCCCCYADVVVAAVKAASPSVRPVSMGARRMWAATSSLLLDACCERVLDSARFTCEQASRVASVGCDLRRARRSFQTGRRLPSGGPRRRVAGRASGSLRAASKRTRAEHAHSRAGRECAIRRPATAPDRRSPAGPSRQLQAPDHDRLAERRPGEWPDPSGRHSPGPLFAAARPRCPPAQREPINSRPAPVPPACAR